METWHGIINSPNDALLLFEACRLGHMKRIQRRLSDSERIAYVKSGAIFLWDEEESGIKRWTDGKHWSPSRINGSFLIYREVEPRKSKIPGMDDRIEYVIKEDGLTKKAISITTSDGRRQHLVSYYLRADLNQRILDPPSSIPSFSELVISTEIYPEFMPENTTPSLASSSSSITSFTSIASTHTQSTTDSSKPNYVPVAKYKTKSARDSSPYRYEPSSAKSRTSQQDIALVDGGLPRPSRDSGKHVSILSKAPLDDGRSFRSYDGSSIRSYDNHSIRSFDTQSVRSFNSRDEPWAPPAQSEYYGSHQGFQVVIPSQEESRRQSEAKQQQQQQQLHHMQVQQAQQQQQGYHSSTSSRNSPSTSHTQLHRTPSVISNFSALTAPPDMDMHRYGMDTSTNHHSSSSPHRGAPSVRSLPIGLSDSHEGGGFHHPHHHHPILPMPKPSSPAHHFIGVQSRGASPTPMDIDSAPSDSTMSGTSNGNGEKPPMFLAHSNWAPGMDYRHTGGSLEGWGLGGFGGGKGGNGSGEDGSGRGAGRG